MTSARYHYPAELYGRISMSGIFDYLKWRGDIPMSAVPLGDADKLILSELSYVEFTNDAPIQLGELCSEMLKKIEVIKESRAPFKLVHHKNDIRLLAELSVSPRFKELRLGHVEKYTDKKNESQFAAMTVYLPNDTVCCVFRGTDWSLVGWKEDFNMTYCDVLPAHERAVEYMKRIGYIHDGKIITTGHSKGGNLAIYASAFCGGEISGRIIDITSLDGPGFSEKLINTPEYKAIADKVHTYMPKASIVGTLFSRMGKFTVIESKARGFMQHIPYNWSIEGPGFVAAAKRDGSGQLVEDALNDWINSLTADERKLFVDTVFSVFAKSDIDELGDLLDGENHRAIIKNYNKLDDDSKKMISDMLVKLRECAKVSLRELISEAKRK